MMVWDIFVVCVHQETRGYACRRRKSWRKSWRRTREKLVCNALMPRVHSYTHTHTHTHTYTHTHTPPHTHTHTHKSRTPRGPRWRVWPGVRDTRYTLYNTYIRDIRYITHT